MPICAVGAIYDQQGVSLVAQLVKLVACNAGDPSSIPGLGRSSGEGIGYPLHILGLPWWLSWLRICLQDSSRK